VAETGSNCEFSRVTSWETFSGTTTDWDSLVASLANSSIYHSSKWAKIQEQRGWDVVYEEPRVSHNRNVEALQSDALELSISCNRLLTTAGLYRRHASN
jgi:hypothetical protein